MREPSFETPSNPNYNLIPSHVLLAPGHGIQMRMDRIYNMSLLIKTQKKISGE